MGSFKYERSRFERSPLGGSLVIFTPTRREIKNEQRKRTQKSLLLVSAAHNCFRPLRVKTPFPQMCTQGKNAYVMPWCKCTSLREIMYLEISRWVGDLVLRNRVVLKSISTQKWEFYSLLFFPNVYVIPLLLQKRKLLSFRVKKITLHTVLPSTKIKKRNSLAKSKLHDSPFCRIETGKSGDG